jgi:mannosyl-oligosaccharide alpha-1,2-mannosidase
MLTGLVISLLSIVSLCSAGLVQRKDLTLPSDASVHRQTVKDVFVSAYRDWQIYGHGKDDATPLNPGGVNSRNGWGATTIDSLTTMKIMGLDVRTLSISA